jgi:hypothetical protein
MEDFLHPMILLPWLNFSVLIVSSVLFVHYYVYEKRMSSNTGKGLGTPSYQLCTRYRLIASVFMTIASVNYAVYIFFPLPIIPLPTTFPWPYWLSVLIALAIGIPLGYLMYRGISDAGEETMNPKKEHTLYTGEFIPRFITPGELERCHFGGQLHSFFTLHSWYYSHALCASLDFHVLGRRIRSDCQVRLILQRISCRTGFMFPKKICRNVE